MENLNLINKMAWSFHYTTGIDFEELKSEATLAYLEAKEKYQDAKNTKDTTFAWTYMRNRLINFCRNEQKVQYVGDYTTFINLKSSEITSFELLDSLPTSCKQIADMVLTSKIDYVGMPAKQARGLIVEQLREIGWSWPKIWKSMEQMKNAINAIPQSCVQYSSFQ